MNLLLSFSILISLHFTSTERTSTYLHRKSSYPSVPVKSPPPGQCYRPVERCLPFQYETLSSFQCLDVTLPYRLTYTPSGILPAGNVPETVPGTLLPAGTPLDPDEAEAQAIDASSKSINDYLNHWSGLRYIPQCWKALHYVLCASFYPKCDDTTSGPSPGHAQILLPTLEMCSKIRSPCALVSQYYHWPSWLACENSTLFSNHSACGKVYASEVPLTTTTSTSSSSSELEIACADPLVESADPRSWYPGIDHCALRCDRNPLYSAGQHTRISRLILVGALFGLSLTLFAIATFFIDSHQPRRPLSKAVLNINCCLLLFFLGWLWQAFTGKSVISCSQAETASRHLRHGGGGGGGGPAPQTGITHCTLSFIFLYYGFMAAFSWLTIFAYCCMVLYRTRGSSSTDRSPSEQLQAKQTNFRVIGWAVPVFFTLIIVFNGEIDGDSLYGVCFVGLASRGTFILFALVPTTVGLILFFGFMGKALAQLYSLLKVTKKDENALRRLKRCRKIHNVMRRIVFVLIWTFIAYVASFSAYSAQQSLTLQYRAQLNDFIVCNLNLSEALEPKRPEFKVRQSRFTEDEEEVLISDSTTENRVPPVNPCAFLAPTPTLLPLYIQLFFIFGNAILATIWICTYSTVASWRLWLAKKAWNGSEYQEAKARRRRAEGGVVPESALETTIGNNNASSGANNNKRRRVAPAEGAIGQYGGATYTGNRRFDPVEMELTSYNSQSWASNLKDKFFPLLNRLNGVSSRNGGQLATSVSTTMAQSTIDQSVSDSQQSNSVTLGQSIDSSSVEVTKAGGGRKKGRKKTFIRNFKRRGSDTSGSMVSTAFITIPKSRLAGIGAGKNGKLECTDPSSLPASAAEFRLLQTALNMAQGATAGGVPGSIGQQQPAFFMPSSLMTPYMTPPMIGQQQPPHQPAPFGHNLGHQFAPTGISGAARQPGQYQFVQQQAFQPPPPMVPMIPLAHAHAVPQTPPVPRPPSTLKQTSFTFTHGMSDQSKEKAPLMNPLEEIRRPDSSMAAPSDPIGSNLVVRPALGSNLAISTCGESAFGSGAYYHPNQLAVPGAFYAGAPQGPGASPEIMFQSQMQYAYAFLAAANNAAQARALPGQYHPTIGYNTLKAQEYANKLERENLTPSELESLAKERAAYEFLCQARATSSSDSHLLLPIALSDSEFSRYASDTSRASQYPGFIKQQAKANRQQVEERLQMLEKEGDQSLNGQTTDKKLSKNGKESTKEKKKSKKKKGKLSSKQNGAKKEAENELANSSTMG